MTASNTLTVLAQREQILHGSAASLLQEGAAAATAVVAVLASASALRCEAARRLRELNRPRTDEQCIGWV